MLNSRKNALRCATVNCAPPPPPPPTFGNLTKFGGKGRGVGLLLAICGFAFLPQQGFAQTSSVEAPSAPSVLTCSGDGTSSYKAGPGACASANSALAVGRLATAANSQAAAFGLTAKAHSENGLAVGTNAHVGTGANWGMALGESARVQNGHTASAAIGHHARTTAANRIDFGAVTQVYRNRLDSGNQFFDVTTSYRFAGLALAETGIGEADLMAGETFTAQQNLTTAQLSALTGAEINARWRIIDRYRSGASSRALVVDGHGVMRAVDADLGNIGTASQDSAGSGTIYQRIAQLRGSSSGGGTSYDDTAVRGLITTNTDAIAAHDTRLTSLEQRGISAQVGAQIDGNTAQGQKNAAGVAMGFALSAVDTHIPQGKKLTLGIGGGSFDGKSAVAIGIAGKWGASKVNAAATSGDGESGVRMGISWSW